MKWLFIQGWTEYQTRAKWLGVVYYNHGDRFKRAFANVITSNLAVHHEAANFSSIQLDVLEAICHFDLSIHTTSASMQ